MDQIPDTAGLKLERDFVRQTYDLIASEFDCTRYKKWPKVDSFIRDLPEHSLLLDVGCGNGKYLDCPSGFSIGCDISQNLLSICKRKGFEVVLCDMTQLPFRREVFDAVISVAALHHIVGSQRRLKCLAGIVETMSRREAKLLVQVWSYEQELYKDNPYLKRKNPDNAAIEVREEVQLEVGLTMPVHVNRTPFPEQDLLVPFNTKTDSRNEGQKRHLRYYHVFKENELDTLFAQIEGLKIEDSYYDRGNWCIIVSRISMDDCAADET